jgi:hypothetical protein
MNPLVIELAFMTVLTGLWLSFHGRVLRLDNGTFPYHVALERRDSRKAKFYFASVWIGLLAAFLSARTLEAMWSVSFDSATQKSWILGGLRGVEMWGLFVVGAVWSRIGLRASQSNMDGKSLMPAPQKREDPKDTADKKSR